MQEILSGLGLVESPRWHDGRLFFADWIAGHVIAVSPDGASEVIVEHTSLPLCFDFLPDGTLVLVSGPRNALLRLDDGVLSVYADLSMLAASGGNDIVVDGRGNAYVGNPNYDPMAGPAPQPPPGFLALVTPEGRAQIVADDLAFPNGIAVTPDNRTLIVAESHRGRLTAFDIGAEGTLSRRRVWADLGAGAAPDGICIDSTGAVWFAEVPGKRCVRVAEGGAVLDVIVHDRGCYACMIGDGDLYVVAAQWPGMTASFYDAEWDGQVLRTPAPAPAAGWPASTGIVR